MKTCPSLARGLFGCLAVSFATVSLLAAEQPAPEAAPPGPPPHGEAGPEQAPGQPPPAAELRQRIRDLHAAGKHEEARKLMEGIRPHRMGRPEGPGGDQPPGKARPAGPPPGMKIRNLRQAAGLLEAAGYHNHAEKARQEAGRIEADLRRHMEEKRQHASDGKRHPMEGERRKDKERAAGPEKRPDADENLRREVKRLRKELEELRGQLREARKEAAERKQ